MIIYRKHITSSFSQSITMTRFRASASRNRIMKTVRSIWCRNQSINVSRIRKFILAPNVLDDMHMLESPRSLEHKCIVEHGPHSAQG